LLAYESPDSPERMPVNTVCRHNVRETPGQQPRHNPCSRQACQKAESYGRPVEVKSLVEKYKTYEHQEAPGVYDPKQRSN
jgi:hypothetical protein